MRYLAWTGMGTDLMDRPSSDTTGTDGYGYPENTQFTNIINSVHIKHHIVLCNIIKDTVITTISLKLLNTVLVW